MYLTTFHTAYNLKRQNMIELSHTEEKRSLGDVMTPMIDVIFVLLAFMMLMINTPLFTMEVDLPQTIKTPASKALNNHVVNIAILPKNNLWYLEGEALKDEQTLIARLTEIKAKHGKQLSIVVSSDKQVHVERMVKLFSLLQKLDLNVTHLALKGVDN